jgi:transposase-like protein
MRRSSFKCPIPKIERFDDYIDWIDLSFVQRERTPRWAIEVGIQCHLADVSLRNVSTFLGELGIDRSHVAIHNWVHSAQLQPASSVSADQLAVDEKVIRLHGQQFWLDGAVDPHTNEIVALSLFPTTDHVTTRWFLDDLQQQCRLRDVTILVDGADHLIEVLEEDGYDYRYEPHGDRNGAKRVFCEVERRTSSFANSFSNVALTTAESWLEAFAVYHNSRQN